MMQKRKGKRIPKKRKMPETLKRESGSRETLKSKAELVESKSRKNKRCWSSARQEKIN